jgi:hypothetical protein
MGSLQPIQRYLKTKDFITTKNEKRTNRGFFGLPDTYDTDWQKAVLAKAIDHNLSLGFT